MSWASFRWWLAGVISPCMKLYAENSAEYGYWGDEAEIRRSMDQVSGVTDAIRGVPSKDLTATEMVSMGEKLLPSGVYPNQVAVPNYSGLKVKK